MQVAKGFMKNVYPCKAAIGLLTQLMSYGVELVEGDILKTTPNQQPLFNIDEAQSLAGPMPAGQDDCHPKSIPGSRVCICMAIFLSSGE